MEKINNKKIKIKKNKSKAVYNFKSIMKEISKGQTTGRRKKKITKRKISQFSLVTQLCLTICDKPTQTHVHCVSGAIQPSHPLSSLSPPTFNVSQHQGLFQ